MHSAVALLLALFGIANIQAQSRAAARENNPVIFDVTMRALPEGGALQVQWYAPENFQNFEVEYRDERTGESKTLAVSGKKEVQLHNLALAHDYVIRVVAFDAQGKIAGRSPQERWWSASSLQNLAAQNQPPAAAAAPTLNATLRSLDSNNFPFIFTTVQIDTGGNPVSRLTAANFSAFEDGVLQTNFFNVTQPDEGGGVRLADFVFIVDNSGSMADEQQAVKDNLKAFVDSLTARQIDYRLGAVRFGQDANGGQPILMNNGNLTGDPVFFKTLLDQMTAAGGFEPGIEATNQAATRFSFRPGSQRHFLLITDEDSDGGNLTQAINVCRNNNIIVHAAVDCFFGTSNLDYCNANSIRGATGGLQFSVAGPYNAILNQIVTSLSNTYIVRYRALNDAFDGRQREVRVTVNAFGQSDFVTGFYTPGAAPKIRRTAATIALSNSATVAGNALVIAAEITDAQAPFVQSATLFYRTTGAVGYNALTLTAVGNNIYQATIPGTAVNSPGIDYYLTATDGQATTNDPAVDASLFPYQIAVLPNQPPQITHTPVTRGTPGNAIAITCNVQDNTNFLSTVELYYREIGTLLFNRQVMSNAGGNNFNGSIPGSAVTLSGVEYYIRAVDNFGVAAVHGVHQVIIVINGNCGGCQTVSIFDSFSDNNFNGWLPRVLSNWTVDLVNGNPAMVMRSGNPNGDEFSLLAAGRWQDFTLELKARSSASSNKNFFVTFGVQSYPNSTSDGYYLRFTPGTVDLFRSSTGNIIASTGGDYVSDNNYHTVRIERQGQGIRVLVDSRLLFAPNDNSVICGFIGVGSFQSTATFDDVSITGCLNNTGVAGPLRFDAFLIDDNASGASTGDGDGRAESGERVELVVALRNFGDLTATQVTALISSSDADVTITDNNNLWPDLPGGFPVESSSNFVFDVNPNLAQQKNAVFTLNVSFANGGFTSSSFQIPLYPGPPPPAADLVADRVYLRTGRHSGPEVSNPVAGQQYYLHFDWSNAGGAASGFRYAMSFNGVEICGVSSVSAAAGDVQTVVCEAAITWPTGGGVIAGALDVHSHIAEPVENNNTASRTFGFQNFGDFDFTAQARTAENLNNNGGADFCFIYGYQDERHYYYVMFNRGTNETRAYKVRGRERIQIGDLGGFVIPDENYHTVRLRRTGSTLEIYWDGALLGRATDSEYGSGGMGLGSFNDTAFWDEVCLKTGSSTCTIFENFEDGVADGWLPQHPAQWAVAADFGDRSYRINDTNFENLDFLRLGEYALIGITTPQPQADLAATRMYLRTGQNAGAEVENPVAGQPYFVHFDWQNAGAAAASNFRTEIKFNGNLLCGQTESANAGATRTTVCATPAIFTPGTNVLQGALDVNGAIAESNENNNAISRSYGCNPSACSGPALYAVPAGGSTIGEPITGRHNSTVCIDIKLQQNTKAINAFGLRVKVNSAQLAFASFTRGNLTQNFVSVSANKNPNDANTIICGGFGTTGIPIGSAGTVLSLCFTVTCNTGDNSEIQIVALTDDVASMSGCCNLFKCSDCAHDGDVNHDFTVTPGDAFCAFNIYLNSGNVTTACDAPNFDCEVAAADVNCDGVVTPGDAFEIFNCFLRGCVPRDCFARPDPGKISTRTAPYILTWRPRIALATAGANLPEVVKVALAVDNPQGLQSFGMRFDYPAERLEFAGIERTALTADWIKLEGTPAAAGQLLLGGFHTQALHSTSAGELLQILFVVKNSSSAAVQVKDFFASDFVDDLSRPGVEINLAGAGTEAPAPNEFALYQNYPNPFATKTATAQTIIRFDLPAAPTARVELAVYNLAGQMVRRLLSAFREPGAYEVVWDGKDEQGRWAPSGTYWYRLQAGNLSTSKQLTVLR